MKYFKQVVFYIIPEFIRFLTKIAEGFYLQIFVRIHQENSKNLYRFSVFYKPFFVKSNFFPATRFSKLFEMLHSINSG